jgi:isopenicillin N synthase-like dioxygenase
MAAIDRIPTIDFREFSSGDLPARRKAADQLGATLQHYGFVSLVGHGLKRSTVDGALQAAVEFFARPESEKRIVQDQQNNRGYIPMFDSTHTGAAKPSALEAFSIGHIVPPGDSELLSLPFYAATPWPDVADFRLRIEKCYGAMYAVGEQVLRAIAMHLGADENFFQSVSENTYSNMRVIHYPPQEKVAHTADFGVNAHVDRGLLTLLIQDNNGGLSVLTPEQEWLPVVPDPDAIVVNVGSLLRRWTNGKYAAALHRVINTSGKERYSMPLFMHPSFHTMIDPQSLVREKPAASEFEPFVAGEEVFEGFRKSRPSWQDASKAAV